MAGRAAALLRPYQFGVGVKGGCEGIIHAVRALLEDVDVPDGDKWLIQVDFENAFNLVDRSMMIAEVRKRMPDISYWVESMYGVEAYLNMGECCRGTPGGPTGLLIVLIGPVAIGGAPGQGGPQLGGQHVVPG